MEKCKAILFGAAGGGMRLFQKVSERYEIVCFTDNDPNKWGNRICGISILDPNEAIRNMEWDEIVVTSAPGCCSICDQLVHMGVSKEKINTSYVDFPLKSRIVFLEKLGEQMQKQSIIGECAEAGVFQGDFAKEINKIFPNKRLYLFDTFNGFAQADVMVDHKFRFSESMTTDYGNSSVDMVMKKMPYKEMCVVKKGYFPETATDINDMFCFVNLDLDLYQPTINGLKWASKRMVRGGVILVHDYFATNFKGPREAVDQFMEENKGQLYAYPIGDGISIMIVGF